MDQKGNPVSDFEGLQPPLDVISEGFLQVNRCDKLVCSPFCGQNPVDEQSSGEKHITGVEKFSGDGSQLLLGSPGLVKPVLQQRGKRLDFIFR